MAWGEDAGAGECHEDVLDLVRFDRGVGVGVGVGGEGEGIERRRPVDDPMRLGQPAQAAPERRS